MVSSTLLSSGSLTHSTRFQNALAVISLSPKRQLKTPSFQLLPRSPPPFSPSHRRRRGISLFTAAMSTNHDSHKFDWHFDTELEDETIELRGKKLFFVIVLFAIVLFTTALFFYARWICRSRGLIPTTTTFASSIHLRHAPPHQQSEGLDAAAIKKLPIVLHQGAPSSPADPNGGGGGAALADCCICLSAFKDGEKLKVIPVCEHWFHCECVDKWLRNHSSCPLCRASLKLDPNSFPKLLIQEPPLRINDRF